MKKIIPLLLLFMLVSCGKKETENMLNSGDYDNAIDNAVGALRNNKNKKGKQPYVYMLEEAFAKAQDRDLRQIDLLVKDANPRNLEEVFTTYHKLNNRQEKIRPLLPLRLMKENRDARFVFQDYSEQIVNSKNALSKYLYDNAKALLASKDKANFRRAYDDLQYLDQINPDYKDVRKLIKEAQFKGTDYVSVYMKNETNMVIPNRLEADLLDFSTYGLNDKWTAYHSNKQKGIDYDYAIVLNFRQINISPEQVKEKEFVKEKLVKVGTKKLLDARGNVVKDSLGKAIMVDDMRTVKSSVYEFRQTKACQVTAKVDYMNLNTNQLLQSFPLSSEFVFENQYATFRGDKRAVEQEYYTYFDQKAVPFPSNEQMVYDTGEDLKAKLKDIITRNRLKRD
ncbi:hypothetical protein HYN48_08375 [Flavobacterium magnum]|uniref:Lipoprotein n=1 Tax=Flavobacterium magnum TaxID=2162713 RepID=A0A2S0RIJ5_9FLAO|nr:hypothetical protein [Flavobacterium magnum]AWA31445.1 hypothetical protein HYN48_08375 [Flavobacterium magnum]